MAALADGGFVVAWQSFAQGPGGGYEIYAQQFDEAGTPVGGEFHVNFGWDGGDDQSVSAAGLADGGYVIVWDDGYPGALGVMGQRYAADGTPVGTISGSAPTRARTMIKSARRQRVCPMVGSW